jgi:F-type H+-transporting ATPase subunit delta
MSSSITSGIAEPYAKALMSLADSQDLVDRLGEDVASLRQLLDESADLKQFLDNPLIKPADKKGVLQRILGDSLHAYTLNFLMLLVDRGRILFLSDVCRSFQALLRTRKQTVLAQVTSTIALTPEQQQTIVDRVKTMTDAREVEIETILDPDIIGGIMVKVGSQFIDASIRGQLRRISISLG